MIKKGYLWQIVFLLLGVGLFGSGLPAANESALATAVGSPNPISTSRVVVDSGGNVGVGTSLRLMAVDHPIIAYFDISGINLKVAACGDTVCSKHTLTVVDGIGDAGSYPSLALDSVGRPVVSYYDQKKDK